MVNQINLSRVSRGSSNRLSFSSESEAVKYARRSIVSNAEIKENTVITEDLLDIKIFSKLFKTAGSTTRSWP